MQSLLWGWGFRMGKLASAVGKVKAMRLENLQPYRTNVTLPRGRPAATMPT